MPTARELLDVLHGLRGLDGDLSLDAVAARAGWSPFHFHRAFRSLVGETPKQYTLRLRLERAAARLVTTSDDVLDVALSSGFESHEVFTRAFRRQFGCTPSRYRTWALEHESRAVRARHAEITRTAGPCVGLYHLSVSQPPRIQTMPTLSIERRVLTPQPFLFMRRKAAKADLATAIGECLGGVFGHIQKAGLPMAGPPLVRYTSMGPGMMTIEGGAPLASAAAGAGDIVADILPGGPAAVALHAGSYDSLHETYVAMEKWAEANGTTFASAPWESYLTDPGEHPDPATWRTEVYWPLET